jgi:hypothetical protein
LPPADESAFIVRRIAVTGVEKLPYGGVDDPLMLENTTGADAPSVGIAVGHQDATRGDGFSGTGPLRPS